MKKIFLVLFILICFNFVKAQEISLVDFSDVYSGKIVLDGTYVDNQDTNSILTIFDKKTHMQIFSTGAFVSEYDFEGDKLRTNILEIPYGEQSVLIYDDFNFDGIDDIAVRVGYYSCYGDPAYDVFLGKKGSFEYNEAFTELAQNYCGFFITDFEKKQIETMTKSGCCWHQYNTYKVENNKPILIESIEETYGALGFLVDYNHSKLENGKMIIKQYQTLPYYIDKPIFELNFKNNKKMVLYEFGDNQLFYGFLNSDEIIELFHSEDFIFNSNTKELIFKKGNTTYEISDFGINVIMPSKSVKLNALKNEYNNFNKSLFDKFENVFIR